MLKLRWLGKSILNAMNQRTRPPKKTREQLEKERKSRNTVQQKESEESVIRQKPSRKTGPDSIKQIA